MKCESKEELRRVRDEWVREAKEESKLWESLFEVKRIERIDLILLVVLGFLVGFGVGVGSVYR